MKSPKAKVCLSNKERMIKISSIVRALPVVLGALYFIADADNIDYEYDWDHSIYPPFTDMEGNMHGWDFKALINSYSFIRLTNDEKSQNGYLFSKTEFQAKDWFSEFQFDIQTSGRNVGDGMAFWFTEKAYQQGEAFGHDEKFKGLGVFFDTFRNGDHEHGFPYVGAMIGDGIKNYHHENDGMGTLVGGCHAKIVNTEHPVRAKVIYASNTLEVLLEFDQEQGWTTCFKAPNVVIPIKKGYIGFTAATGDAHARHDILSLTTAKIDTANADRFIKSQTFRMTEKKGSYFFGFLLLISLAGGVYYYYINNKKKTRF